MKNFLVSLVVLFIIGVSLSVGIVLSAFGAVIAGVFYFVEIIATVIMTVIMTLIVIIGGIFAVLFSPNEEKKEKDNAG
uniref:Uncharacterized protein n=1 Tax=Myoviridae sp. ctwVB15 TaxID=2825208 RepID=A0A8S5UNC2_9CAUD|nr:MAG TPA: hypothetical protein [Myoviridae sp. ctwVB15]